MRSSESGNAIFYIFVAVALLGALTFAVSQSSRSSGKALTEDRAQLAASEVISYTDDVAKSVGQLRLRGVQPYALRFSHPSANAAYGVYDTEPTSEIFNPQGGGVLYHQVPLTAVSGPPANYNITGGYGIQDIGSTCNTAACSDLIITAVGLRKEVCQMANSLLHIGEKTDEPPEDDAIPTTPYFTGNNTGTPNPYSYSSVIGSGVDGAALRGRTAGCYYSPAGTSYIYYQVLISR